MRAEETEIIDKKIIHSYLNNIDNCYLKLATAGYHSILKKSRWTVAEAVKDISMKLMVIEAWRYLTERGLS